MKAIKKLVLIFALCIATCGFAACEEKTGGGEMLLVIGTATPIEYVVELDGLELNEGLLSVLKHLKEEKGLSYSAATSAYGTYLTEVGGLAENAASSTYIYFYTSVEKDFDVSAYATTIDYKGKTLTSSGVGAGEMTIESGCTIYIGTIVY